MLRGMLLAGGGVPLLVCAVAAAPAAPSLRLYSQSLEVEYATADEAGRARVEFAPVYDGREWAFSARWDDCSQNSLQMRQHMAKFGLKGTFYLTQNDGKKSFGPDYCKQLMEGGFSIGGHTMTHPKLPELNAGAIWWELCANRVAREDDTETPLNSLAFSYGQFRGGKPEAFLAISEAVRRTGYHHCVYADFVRGNPNLAAGEFSTGCQVVPGDRVVDAKAFQEQLDKPVSKQSQAYRAWSHCIFLGVHAWQAGEEWNKLEAVFQTIAGKSEWWYCNQTEWAAYARQVSGSELTGEAVAAAASARRYTLTRPAPGDLGAMVPLTCVIDQVSVRGIKLDGQPVAFERRGDKTVVNLPHGQAQALPQRIGHLEMPSDAQALTDSLQCEDFPGLKGLLVTDLTRQKVSLTLEAPAAAELRNLHIRFRLPLRYESGIITRTLDDVKAGAPQTVEIALPTPKAEAFWAEGPQYWVAEIDFTGPAGAGRLFVTRLVP